MTADQPLTSGDDSAPASPGRPIRRWARRIVKGLGFAVVSLLLIGILLWTLLAVYYADTHADRSRWLLAPLVAATMVASLLFIRPRRYGLAAYATLFVVVLIWFLLLKPSNSRDWAPGVARVASIQIDGDRITVHNVRNFDYRSETDFTPTWVDRSYDLSKLRSADLMLCYWGSKAIAHAMVSFGFEGDEYLAVSIETRKEKTEEYSAIQGFFRQYELIYVFADERDVVRLRTNYRHEDVYLYRTNATPDQAKTILLSYLNRANALEQQAKFYNALTSNCATNVLVHARAENPAARITWEILLSGYAARQAYRNGRLDTSLPFEALEAQSRINDAAMAADKEGDFSKKIRAGLPSPVETARAGISQHRRSPRS